jgi:molybdate transport system regulatory protein
MSRQPSALTVRLRIDVGPASSIGPGKIALLERIELRGSLSQAARELGMSYRRAWMLLDDLNRAFAEPATTTSIGGSGGGGAQLTDFGRALIASYREVERQVDELASDRFGWIAPAPAASRESLRSASRRPLARRRMPGEETVAGPSARPGAGEAAEVPAGPPASPPHKRGLAKRPP